MSIRDQIISANDREAVEMNVPEWGVKVYIRGMTAEQRDQFELTVYFSDKKTIPIEQRYHNLRARLVSMCMCDADGNPIFDESTIDDLGRKNAKVVSRIYAVAQRVCGMTEGDVEELMGKSEPDRSESTSSD